MNSIEHYLHLVDVYFGPLIATGGAFLLGWIIRGLREERRQVHSS